jgi:hypothetical protein
MENLLATPVRRLEVMLGKIVPYIVVGYVQVVVILTAAKFLFQVPMLGSLLLLSTSRPLHRHQPRHRLHLLDAREEPDAGECR